MTNPVYLDHNATTPVKPDVIEAMAEAMAIGGNPSSVHAQGRAARQMVFRAREQVAALVGVSPEAIVFTSGGTEANNQALAGGQRPVLASAIEHPSVLAVSDHQQPAPVDGDGMLDLTSLARLLEGQRPATLAVMMANNETGVIQPVKEAAAIAHEAGVRLHVDAVQAAGKIPVDFFELGADTLSLSAHKMGGPQGVGALIFRPGVEPLPLLQGGSQEQRFRAGTENVPGIVGFGAAAALALEDDGYAERVGALRDRLEAEILALAPDAKIVGGGASRLANTTCLVLPGLGHDTQLIHFDLAGIAVSAGSACSSGKVAVSPVLAAMGLPVDEASCAIRISFGWNSRDSDVERFLDACRRLLARRQRRESA
ncbi:MAG: cysteine desulfurase [Alphaproteobacteria bacterium]|nr:cysteine desulfurase [Alphaproteobacteria bacterium]